MNIITIGKNMDFLPVYKPDLSGNELEYVTEAVRSGWISSLGKYVGEFEKSFADCCDVKYAVSVANGTLALQLALILFEIGPGDEVIVPSLTFVATANVVRHVGAVPVFADVDPETWTIDVKDVAEKITSKTKAIIPVHLYGHPANMDGLKQIAGKHRIKIIEDAAEAHGAKYKGRVVGGIGDVACFSFYGNKAVTTGEGGMLTTNDITLAEKARYLKDHGMDPDRYYWHSIIGYNFRMTNLQAAVGVAQLERFNEMITKKRKLGQMYKERLMEVPEIEIQPEADWAENSYWMNSIVLNENFPVTRDKLREILYELKIDTRPFFYPLHQLPPYNGKQVHLPVSERLAAGGINLPSYPSLSEADVNRICDVIRSVQS